MVIQRSLATPSLALFRLLGMIVAVVLVCSVSIYRTTMGDTMLQASLSSGDSLVNVAATPRSGQRTTMAAYRLLDEYLRRHAAADLQLPVLAVQTHHQSLAMPIYPWREKVDFSTQPLGTADYEFYDGFARHIRMVAGGFPSTGMQRDGSIKVIVSRSSAARLHLRIGESIKLVPNDGVVSPVRLVIAGIYSAINPKDSFWDVSASLFATDALIVPDVASYLALSHVYGAVHSQLNWLLRLDTAAIRLQDIDAHLATLNAFGNRVAGIMAGATVQTSLETTLSTFRDSFALLGLALYALALPVVGIILYYIMVATGLVMEQQSAEIVLLRSRGATTPQIIRIYLIESVLFAVVAVVAGPFVALPLAHAIGAASGFLSFHDGGSFPVEIQGQTFLIGLAAAVLAVLAALAAALRAVRFTMAGFVQEQGRRRGRSLWQRFYLDVVILAVALYGYWVLSRQGPIISGDQQTAITQDPILVLAPTAFVIASVLFVARVLPPLAALLAFAAGRAGPAVLLALRGISRVPQQYTRLVTLLSLTLAVAVFVAAIAGTVKRNTEDAVAFRAGCTLRLIEYDSSAHDFNALPASWHERQPGVTAASPALRLETYQASLAAPDDGQAPILGIDPATIERVIWFRPDFASRPLHQLLAALAANPSGIIVSEPYLRASGLRVGDTVNVAVLGGGFQATIVGTVRYFPTFDASESLFGLVNIKALLRQAQAQGGPTHPSEMWLHVNGGASSAAAIATAVRRTGREVISYQMAAPAALNRLDNPLQVGLYGVVSIGFVVAAGLSMLSFFVYAYLSARRRATEFAVLRALGISPVQTGSILIVEQVALIILGAGSALIIGLLASRLFVPYLPLTDSPIPPLLLDIPWAVVWELVAIVGAAVVPTLAALTWLMGHLQVSRVLRMGDV